MNTLLPNENRIGRVCIPDVLIRDFPSVVADAFAGCIVVRSEYQWARKGIVMDFLSPNFPIVEDAMEPKESGIHTVWVKELVEYEPGDNTDKGPRNKLLSIKFVEGPSFCEFTAHPDTSSSL